MDLRSIFSSNLHHVAPPPPPPPPPEPVLETTAPKAPAAAQDAAAIRSGSGSASDLSLSGAGEASGQADPAGSGVSGEDLDGVLGLIGSDLPVPETAFNDEQLKSIYENYQVLRHDPEKLLEAMTEFNVSAKDIQIAVSKFGPSGAAGAAGEALGPAEPYVSPFDDEQLKNIFREFSNLAGPEPGKLRELMTEFGVSAKDIQVAADKFFGQVPGVHNDFDPRKTSQLLDYLFADGFGGHVLSKEAPALREPTPKERDFIEWKRATLAAGEHAAGSNWAWQLAANPPIHTGPITQAELVDAYDRTTVGGWQEWEQPNWRENLEQKIADSKAHAEYLKSQSSGGRFAMGPGPS